MFHSQHTWTIQMVLNQPVSRKLGTFWSSQIYKDRNHKDKRAQSSQSWGMHKQMENTACYHLVILILCVWHDLPWVVLLYFYCDSHPYYFIAIFPPFYYVYTCTQAFSHCISINVLLPSSPWQLITIIDSCWQWINIADIYHRYKICKLLERCIHLHPCANKKKKIKAVAPPSGRSFVLSSGMFFQVPLHVCSF